MYVNAAGVLYLQNSLKYTMTEMSAHQYNFSAYKMQINYVWNSLNKFIKKYYTRKYESYSKFVVSSLIVFM